MADALQQPGVAARKSKAQQQQQQQQQGGVPSAEKPSVDGEGPKVAAAAKRQGLDGAAAAMQAKSRGRSREAEAGAGLDTPGLPRDLILGDQGLSNFSGLLTAAEKEALAAALEQEKEQAERQAGGARKERDNEK